MAAWKFACKTMLGMNLDLKLVGRENLPLRLTRAVSGSGSVNPTQLMSLTEITGLTQELQLLDAVEHIGENVVMIPVILRNSDVKKKYDMYQLGIYAEDPDLGEILYIVLQSESAEEIPAAAEMKDFKLEWYINLSVSNADHIEVVIDETGVLTVEQGDARYVDQTVYGTDRDRWNNGSATYGTCETAAGTTAKTVACTGFKLAAGAEITVKFTVTNTASNPTLNVNGSGAKPIYYRGAAISAGYLAAGRTYDFRYNGTQWDLVGDINTNTTYGPMTAATADAAGKAGLVPAPGAGKQTSYLRGDGTWAVPTNTTYSVMTGATASAAGKSGLVPAPAAGTQGEVLKGDGTWDLVENLSVSFSQASSRANITSKEDLKTSLGKIAKWFADLAAGAASTLLGNNLTASRALVSNSTGKVAVSAVTSTELGYLDGVTSNVQTQLDALNTGIAGKAPAVHGHDWSAINGKPATYAPSAHTHDDRYYLKSEVDGMESALSRRCGTAVRWIGLYEQEITLAGGTTFFQAIPDQYRNGGYFYNINCTGNSLNFTANMEGYNMAVRNTSSSTLATRVQVYVMSIGV